MTAQDFPSPTRMVSIVSSKQYGHTISLLLTKLVWSRWLDMFYMLMDLVFISVHKHSQYPFIICMYGWQHEMNQIPRHDWLPMWSNWSYFA